MSFLGRLLGSPSALAETAGTVVKSLDGFIYSKQEKAHDHAKSITEGRDMIIKWMGASQGQNLSRRLIALSITFTWLFMFVGRMGLSMAGLWSESEAFEKAAAIIGDNIEQMTGAVMLILGFYFAAPHLSSIVGPALARFGKKNS
jgi:hypothetical protein